MSEQITLTEPSVSTVLRDLQRILFLRMIFAVMVKDAVSAMGRPSGTFLELDYLVVLQLSHVP